MLYSWLRWSLEGGTMNQVVKIYLRGMYMFHNKGPLKGNLAACHVVPEQDNYSEGYTP